jgi:serine/threonine protein kinase
MTQFSATPQIDHHALIWMDHYEFQDSVGEGTYGKVFKARVKSNGRTVAIKKFKESDEDEAVRHLCLLKILPIICMNS